MAHVMFKCFDCEFISNSMQDVKIHIQREHETEDNNSESNNDPMPLVEMSDNRNSDQDSSNVTARVMQTGMKWAHQMVLYLIECYKKHQAKFHTAGYHGKQVWKIISKDFSKKYGEMSGESCYEKWRNLKKTYIRIKRNLETYGTTQMKFLYFDEMDSIYSKDPDILRSFSHKKGLSEKETKIAKVPEIKQVSSSPTKVLVPVIKKINSSPSEIQFFHLNSNTILTSVNQKQKEIPKESPKQTLPHCCSHLLAEIKKLEEAREVSAQRRHQENMALKRELINIKKQKLLMIQKLDE